MSHTDTEAKLPQTEEDLLQGLLTMADRHGDEELFRLLGLLLSERGRTTGQKVRAILARRIVAEMGGDKRAAGERLGYQVAQVRGGTQTMSNFYRLADGKDRAGKPILTDDDPA